MCCYLMLDLIKEIYYNNYISFKRTPTIHLNKKGKNETACVRIERRSF